MFDALHIDLIHHEIASASHPPAHSVLRFKPW